jgi:hypothetical protein
MTSEFLSRVVPDSNRVELSFSGGNGVHSELMESVYSNGFVGAFIDDDDEPEWARRAAQYLDDEFLHDTPGKLKLFGDVLPMLVETGDGECMPNCRYALDAWAETGEGVKPYTTQQDFGSCVDASCAEHEDTLFGYRAKRMGEVHEQWKHSAAWYKYAERGYCSDGWNGSGIATVARRVGVAFRIRYAIGSQSVDFSDDDSNERLVARTWCRSGIPGWLKEYTVENHSYEDGAITRFQGGLSELKAVFAAGGVIHTSGRRTSGGSKPFTLGSVGPHMQSGVLADDSDEFRQFCQDVIGVPSRLNDFPIALNQTWGGGWRGECADEYWPEWWGIKPQGAWVWWASDVLRLLSVDYAWLPWVTGFPADGPTPPPDTHPNIGGELYAQHVGDKIAIRGTLQLDDWEYIAVPKPQSDGRYVVVPKPEV